MRKFVAALAVCGSGIGVASAQYTVPAPYVPAPVTQYDNSAAVPYPSYGVPQIPVYQAGWNGEIIQAQVTNPAPMPQGGVQVVPINPGNATYSAIQPGMVAPPQVPIQAAPVYPTTPNPLTPPSPSVSAIPSNGMTYGGVRPPTSLIGQDPSPFDYNRNGPGGMDGPCLTPSPTVWFSADYLYWFFRQGPKPGPLVTTGTLQDFQPGILGAPTTSILFGSDSFDFRPFNGMRYTAGFFMDDARTFGLEVSAFGFEKRSLGFTADGGPNGQFYIARPFTNTLTGGQDVFFVSQNFDDPAITARMTGRIDILATSRLWGLEFSGVSALLRERNVQADLIAGFRHVDLREDLQIRDRIQNLDLTGGARFNGQFLDANQSVLAFDHFSGVSRFYGPQVGGRIGWSSGRYSLDLMGKVGLGVSQMAVNIVGQTTLFNANNVPVQKLGGGVLAVNGGTGRFTREDFAVLPELALNLGVDITPWMKAKVGYTFLYWNKVARPGDQIDRSINPNVVPSDAAFGTPGGPPKTYFGVKTSDFWAQGINFGIEIRH